MRFFYGKTPRLIKDDILLEDFSAFPSNFEKINGYGPIISFLVLVAATALWLASGIDPLWPFLSLLSHPFSILPVLLIMLSTNVAHEVIHFASFPGFWKDKKAGFGFMPKILTPYAWYAGVLSKNRAMTSMLAPFVWLTCMPLVIQLIFHPFGQESYMPWVSIFNAMSSGGDLLLSTIIFLYVPRGAYMQGTIYGMKLKSSTPSPHAL